MERQASAQSFLSYQSFDYDEARGLDGNGVIVFSAILSVKTFARVN